MIVAVWFKLFGVGNAMAWKFMQVLGDVLIAFLVYLTAKDVFGRKLPATIAFILYCASPFVAVYAGMMLTEVSSVFCIVLFIFLWHRYFLTKKILYLVSGVFFMSYLSEIRPVYFYFMVGLFVVTLLLMLKMRVSWYKWIPIIVAFILPISYAIAGNYVMFGRISPLVVDGGFSRQLVGSEYMEGRAPHPIDRPGGFPDRVVAMQWALGWPYDGAHRDSMANDELKEGIAIARKDPMHFLRERLNKAWYIWEKQYLFIFTEAPQAIETAVSITNLLLILFAVLGITYFGTRPMQWHQRIIWLTCIAIILYTTVAHMVSDGEERYSLPAYPILFIFAGYALSIIKDLVRKPVIKIERSNRR